MEKKAITNFPIDDLIARRWSSRAFDPEKMLSREQIISLCEAGRWAPSCFGDEPWKFIICDKSINPHSWEKLFACINEWNQRWVKNAPLLILALSDTKFRNGDENKWGQFDTGAASENIYLQAVSLGLIAHPIAGFDYEKVRKEFAIPDQYIINAIIVIGYPGKVDILEADLQELELKPRFRRAFETNFFDGSLDKKFVL